MIKKFCIIFTFVLMIFNIIKVEAVTAEGLTEVKENEQQTTEEYIEEINTKKPGLAIEAKDLADCKNIEGVKVLVENEDKTLCNEYTTDKYGVICIDNLNPGEYKIQILERPEEYILDDTIYTKEVGENTDMYYTQLLNMKHKIGHLLIECNVGGAIFEVITENCVGSYEADSNGKLYLENLNTGICIVTQYSLEGEIIGETVETKIEENEVCRLEFLNDEENKKQEEINPEEKEEDKKQEEIKAEENEENKKQEEINPEEKEEDKKQEEINPEEKEENKKQEEINPEEKEEDKKQEEIKPEENEENKKQEEIKPEEKEEKKQEEIKPEENEEGKKQEEIRPEENEENKKQEEIKPEEKEEDKKQEAIKSEENREIEKAGKENIKSQINQAKLPKTGNDYFEIKLIIFNSIVFIIFISIMHIKNKK